MRESGVKQLAKPDGTTSGKWHYTVDGRDPVTGERRTVPHTCCMKHEPHGTKEEALACFKAFQLTHHLRFDTGENATSQHRCAVCREWTGGTARIGGYWVRSLCIAHQTSEAVATLYEAPEWSLES